MPIVTNEFVEIALRSRAYVEQMEASLAELKAYLCSEKFQAWDEHGERLNATIDAADVCRVNVKDVLLRLQEAQSAACHASEKSHTVGGPRASIRPA